MKHRFIKFLDSRWGFVHRLQAGFFAILVAGLIVGVSALATLAAPPAEPAALSSTSAATASGATATTEITQIPAAAKTTLSKLDATQTASAATSTPLAKNAPCNQTLRKTAINTHQRAIQRETSRHRHELRSLQNTGLVTRFLNPTMYSYKVTTEASKHHKILQSIQAQFKRDLAKANCNS